MIGMGCWDLIPQWQCIWTLWAAHVCQLSCLLRIWTLRESTRGKGMTRAPKKQISKEIGQGYPIEAPFIMKPNKVGISLQNAYAYVLLGSLMVVCEALDLQNAKLPQNPKLDIRSPCLKPQPRSWGCALGFRLQGLGFRLQGLGFRVQGLGFRVQALGFRVQAQGLGFRVWGLGDQSRQKVLDSGCSGRWSKGRDLVQGPQNST